MAEITVIGGGIAGLTAAISCAGRGVCTTVYESHSTLGGRARSTSAPYIANDGTHTFYCNGEPWQWLVKWGLVPSFSRLSAREAMGMRFRREGKLRMTVPIGYLKMIARGRRLVPPVDRSFRDWGVENFGDQAVKDSVGFLGPVLYDANPGRLSASFVFERLLRVGTPRFPLPTRYVTGGWAGAVDQMARRARELGVKIETGSRMTELPRHGPVIVATSLDAARALLDDGTLRWESGTSTLLDLAMTPSKRDRCDVFDMDDGGFIGHYSDHDASLAPEGESLFQGEMPMRRGESKADCLARLEGLYDLAAPDWRGRVTWRRDYVSRGRTGALDLPGTTWRDRPAIDRGGDVFLAGDSVAAPGILAEVSLNSGRAAADLAVERLTTLHA